MEDSLKNNAVSIAEEMKIEEGFYVLKFQNDTNSTQLMSRDIDNSFIQFHFNVKGNSKFLFNNASYELPLPEENSLLLYNPQRNLPLNVSMEAESWLISLVISIKKFHALFSQEADYITFLSEDNKDKKYYKDAPVSPSMAVVLNQLMNFNLTPSIKNLYF